jgi:hypothetical protein
VIEMSADSYAKKYRDLENPYAKLSMVDDPPDSVAMGAQPVSIRTKEVVRKAPKALFKSECKRLFSQYMPAVEQGKLRQHYKDFITRNEDQTAEKRGALLAALARYDLASSGYRSQFNRERASLTESKLRTIERQVEQDDGNSL